MKTARQVAEEILKLVKDNGFIIRGYEGESCCVIIENDHDGASIDNHTQEIDE